MTMNFLHLLGNDRNPGTGFTSHSQRTRQLDKIHETIVYRHWTIGSTRLRFLRGRQMTNEVSTSGATPPPANLCLLPLQG